MTFDAEMRWKWEHGRYKGQDKEEMEKRKKQKQVGDFCGR